MVVIVDKTEVKKEKPKKVYVKKRKPLVKIGSKIITIETGRGDANKGKDSAEVMQCKKLKISECNKKDCLWFNAFSMFNCDNPDYLSCKNNNFNEFETLEK